jgi:hypothetical protein
MDLSYNVYNDYTKTTEMGRACRTHGDSETSTQF